MLITCFEDVSSTAGFGWRGTGIGGAGWWVFIFTLLGPEATRCVVSGCGV